MTSEEVKGGEPRLLFLDCPGASKSGPNGDANANTHRMAYWEWDALDGGDNSHVIVAVHGLTRNGRDFDVLAQQLRARARVVCPDIVGRGHSDWLADGSQYQVPLYLNDMLFFLAALAKQTPSRVDLICNSMGGVFGIAVAAAKDLPVPLGRLVLNDVGPVIEWEALQRIGANLDRTPLQVSTLEEGAAKLRALAAGFGPHTEAQWLALSTPMFRPLGGGWTTHYDPEIATSHQVFSQSAAQSAQAVLWAMYDAIEVPTLLLRGQDSDLLTAKTAQEMAERGPKAKVLEFAQVGHAPTLVQREQIAPLQEFLFSD